MVMERSDEDILDCIVQDCYCCNTIQTGVYNGYKEAQATEVIPHTRKQEQTTVCFLHAVPLLDFKAFQEGRWGSFIVWGPSKGLQRG